MKEFVEEIHSLIPGYFPLVFIYEIKDVAGSGDDEEFAFLFGGMEFLAETLYLLKRSGAIFFPMNQQDRRPNPVHLVDG